MSCCYSFKDAPQPDCQDEGFQNASIFLMPQKHVCNWLMAHQKWGGQSGH